MLETTSPPRRRSRVPLIILCLVLLGGLVAIGPGIGGALGYTVYANGPGSMGKTLAQSNQMVVRHVAPADIHRGDIIVFEDSAWPDSQRMSLTKRVIAVGGDTVACCDGQGRITVNGKLISEGYVSSHGPQIQYTATVPAGHFFVAGDNRDNSRDSRIYTGPGMQFAIPAEAIQGVVAAQRSGFQIQSLPAVTAFTDAGLPGATPADDGYLRSMIAIGAGVVVAALGALGLVVLLILWLVRRRAA